MGLRAIFPASDSPTLFTSLTNPNLLGAEVTNFSEDGEISEKFQVVIDLRDGSVTTGSIQDPTIPPTFLDDPTGGYELELNGRIASLTSGNLRYDITLFSPMDGDISVTFLYFFVSQKFQRAYLFHVAEIDCRIPGVFFSGCVDCSTCVLEQNYVSIVDLQSVSASVRVFDYRYGLFLNDPGPFNSLRVVYDDLQFAMLGPTLCGTTPFLFFDEASAVEGSFRPSDVSAIVPGYATPREATAYRPSTQEITVDSQESLPYTIAESMIIQEVRLIDGEVIRTINVDMEQIRNLAGFDISRFVVPPPDLPTTAPVSATPAQSPASLSPMIAPAQPPVMVGPTWDAPSIPTIRIANPALPSTPLPTVAPIATSRPTWAPIPTVPIPFLGSPILQPTVTSAPMPTPVSAPVVAPITTRAPIPTVPIPFLGSPTQPTVPIPFLTPSVPSNAPPVAQPPTLSPAFNVPTIPIAWGPAVPTVSIQDALASASSLRCGVWFFLLLGGLAALHSVS